MASDQLNSDRKNKTLVLETKLEIFDRLCKGESGSTLAKQYGVSNSTVSEIKRKGDILLEYASNLRVEDGLKKRKTLRTARNTALEEALYRWVVKRKEAGDPVSGPLICEKALEINLSLGGSPEFKASTGWLKNFKTRNNIKMQDLVTYDFATRALKNKLQQGQDIEDSVCESEMQYPEGVNGCSVLNTTSSDSEMDSQLSSDRTILVDPDQEISDAVSSILQSPDPHNTHTDGQECSVSFSTVTTVLNLSDQENSVSIGAERTDLYSAVLLPPEKDLSDIQQDDVHMSDEKYSGDDEDSYPEVIHSSSSPTPQAVEEGNTVPYISVKKELLSPHINSETVEGSFTNSHYVSSVLPDHNKSDAVEEQYTEPYISVKTDLLSPQYKNCVADEKSLSSFPVTSILPDLDNCDAAYDDRVPMKIEIKQEAPDVEDDDLTTEDDSGPSDKDALGALDTAIAWLERQPDKNPSHLITLRSIQKYAIYKERLSSLTH